MSSIQRYAIMRGRESGVDRSKSFRITTIGMERVEAAVSELLDIDKDKAVKAGLRDMGNVFVSGGKKRLRVRLKHAKGAKGNLFRGFSIRIKRRRVGALVGFNRFGRHSHLVDEGTAHRYTKKGAYRGVMPANSFWTDTAEEDWQRASDKLFEGIERAKNRIIERNAY